MLRNFLFLITFVASVNVFAAITDETRMILPDEPKSNIQIIPTFGLNTFGYRGSDVNTTRIESTGGMAFGVLAEKKLGQDFSFGTGLIYQQTGTEIRGYVLSNGAYSSASYEETLSYLAAPLYVKYVLIDNNSKLFVRAGAQFGYLVRAKATYSEYDFDYEQTIDVYRDFNVFDVMLQPALGAEFPISENSSLVLDISFNYGITKLLKEADDVRNEGFNFLGGFAINL